ncbi:unnamed protein product, partial [Brassica oleracea]
MHLTAKTGKTYFPSKIGKRIFPPIPQKIFSAKIVKMHFSRQNAKMHISRQNAKMHIFRQNRKNAFAAKIVKKHSPSIKPAKTHFFVKNTFSAKTAKHTFPAKTAKNISLVCPLFIFLFILKEEKMDTL